MLVTVCGSRKNDGIIKKMQNMMNKNHIDNLIPKLLIEDFGIDAIRGTLYSNYQRILKSDIVIVITKDMGSSTIMELGMAYCSNKHIIAFGKDDDVERYACYNRVLDVKDYNSVEDAMGKLISILIDINEFGITNKNIN